jgi:hypothetical protein
MERVHFETPYKMDATNYRAQVALLDDTPKMMTA